MKQFPYILGKLLLAFTGLSSNFTFMGAQNLVPNPSFENIIPCTSPPSACWCNHNTHCPGFGNPCPGDRITHWYNPSRASPDARHSCASSFVTSTTGTFFGATPPRTGQGYMTLRVYNGWYEYICVPLISPLVAGVTYRVSFYVTKTRTSCLASRMLGAYLRTGTLSSTSHDVLSAFTPQVMASTYITDTNNWIEIAGLYLASGGEDNLCFGVFTPWNLALTPPQRISTPCDAPTQANATDINIDDVSVIPFIPLGFDSVDVRPRALTPKPINLNATFSHEHLNLSGLNVNTSYNLTVYDVFGKIVINLDFDTGLNTSYTYPTHRVPAGVYSLKLTHKPTQNIFNLKVISL